MRAAQKDQGSGDLGVPGAINGQAMGWAVPQGLVTAAEARGALPAALCDLRRS